MGITNTSEIKLKIMFENLNSKLYQYKYKGREKLQQAASKVKAKVLII